MRVVEPSCEYGVVLGSSVGRGGEGEVFRVAGRPDIVAKIIHPERRNSIDSDHRRTKLVAQIQSRPQSRFLCWPSGILFDDNDNWLGFVMPAVAVDALPWASFSNLYSRLTQAPAFDLRYALTAIRNLCNAFDTVHSAGGVVGDVNESNVLVGADASVWVIDCDSQQFSRGDQEWLCTVGKEEFCAPELVGSDFKSTPRTPSSDVFGLAVLAFQMLSGGSHPFDAVSEDTDTDLEPLPARVKSCSAPLFVKTPGLSSPARVPIGAIPDALVSLIRDSLLSPAHLRPTLAAWYKVLTRTEESLRECKKVKSHLYTSGKSCPWCNHSRLTGVNIWPSRVDQQVLPFIDLKSRKDVNVQRVKTDSSRHQGGQQSVSFRSYLGLFLAHPALAVRFFWRKVRFAERLAPPSRPGHPTAQSICLLAAALLLSASPVALLWFVDLSGRPGLLLPAARLLLATFALAGAAHYALLCTRQYPSRIFSFSPPDLWKMPTLSLFSSLFWLAVVILVLVDAFYRLVRFIYWLWRAN